LWSQQSTKQEQNMNGNDIETLTASIDKAIKKAKRSGTVGMSYGNLRMIADTRGLTCSVGDFHRMFPQLADIAAKRLRFELYE
jgi:hypothetical protein